MKEILFTFILVLMFLLYGCEIKKAIKEPHTQDPIIDNIGEIEDIIETEPEDVITEDEIIIEEDVVTDEEIITDEEIVEDYTTEDIEPVEPSPSVYPKIYTSDSCEITIIKEWYENAWCYAAHLKFTDYSKFGTACANGAYNNGFETTSDAAERLNVIFAVNGCYSAPYLNYVVVRSGVICNGAERSLYTPGVYSSNNGLLLSGWEVNGTPGIAGVNTSKLVNDGLVTDTFCFGPPHLQDGVVSESSSTSRAQRTFMGTNGEPGDIWVVVSDGRYNDGESAGLTHTQTGQYLLSKGCTFGIGLDGGGSSTMYFDGEVLNAAKTNQRAVVDFVYYIG